MESVLVTEGGKWRFFCTHSSAGVKRPLLHALTVNSDSLKWICRHSPDKMRGGCGKLQALLASVLEEKLTEKKKGVSQKKVSIRRWLQLQRYKKAADVK